MKAIRKIRPVVQVLAVAILMSGCAGSISNMKELPAGTTVASPGPGESLVVFTRTSGVGFAIQSSVFEVRNNQSALIGILAAKTKLAYRAMPGSHLFMVIGENADFLTADLAPGMTYYVDVSPRMGVWKARFAMEPKRTSDLGTPEFKSSVDECRWVEKTAASENWALGNMASIESKRTEYYADWLATPEKERAHLAAQDGM